MARKQGTVSLTQDTAAILSAADVRKTHVVLWIPSGAIVYISATEAGTGAAATRVQLEAGKSHIIPSRNEEIWGLTPDVAGADVGVWDCYKT
jgi:hypothetical protein